MLFCLSRSQQFLCLLHRIWIWVIVRIDFSSHILPFPWGAASVYIVFAEPKSYRAMVSRSGFLFFLPMNAFQIPDGSTSLGMSCSCLFPVIRISSLRLPCTGSRPVPPRLCRALSERRPLFPRDITRFRFPSYCEWGKTISTAVLNQTGNGILPSSWKSTPGSIHFRRKTAKVAPWFLSSMASNMTVFRSNRKMRIPNNRIQIAFFADNGPCDGFCPTGAFKMRGPHQN